MKNKEKIDELDQVALVNSKSNLGLIAGDVGTVVEVYKKGKAYEVEFFTGTGENSTVVTLESADVRKLTRNDIIHSRPITKNWGTFA